MNTGFKKGQAAASIEIDEVAVPWPLLLSELDWKIGFKREICGYTCGYRR